MKDTKLKSRQVTATLRHCASLLEACAAVVFQKGDLDSHRVIADLAKALRDQSPHPILLRLFEALEARLSLLRVLSTDWRLFMAVYQAAELVSKLDCLDFGVNRAEAAVKKFLEMEEVCSQTNLKLVSLDSTVFPTADVSSVFHRARRKIERLLGRFSWEETEPFLAFGPGASVGVTRRRSHAVNKFGLERPTTTGECATLAEAFIKTSPQWCSTVPVLSGRSEDCFSVVRGSRVTTVPKNAKTDRVIAIEPLMNMFFQKGIGGVIRRRLRGVGVNLDCQLRNQEKARQGSLDGSLATIDLSSASDCVSRGLVEWLMPDDWKLAMKICRSKSSVLPSGEEIFLQKFSSMGNGYTFELESLIFWALSSECTHLMGESTRDNCVYGDDIIVPVGVVPLLLEVLEFAGFKPNSSKSFWEGPFRESCGKHFFLGHEVTPLYVRKHVGTPERKLWLANSIRRLASRFVGYGYGCDKRFEGAYLGVIRELPRKYRNLSIPEGFGDGGLVRDFDEARPRRHRYFDAYVYPHLYRSYSCYVPSGQPALTCSLFFLERQHERVDRMLGPFWRPIHASRGDGSLEITTQRFSERIVKSLAPQWVGLGPWLEGF